MKVFVVRVFFVDFRHGLRLGGGGSRDDGRDRLGFGGLRFIRMRVAVVVMAVFMIVSVFMRVVVIVRSMIMIGMIVMFRVGMMMFIAMGVNMAMIPAVLVRLIGLRRLRRIGACAFHYSALHPLAMAAAARVAMA
jgi:hypothetical protein